MNKLENAGRGASSDMSHATKGRCAEKVIIVIDTRNIDVTMPTESTGRHDGAFRQGREAV